jgi:GNAT superfamily N-acetyltransferase
MSNGTDVPIRVVPVESRAQLKEFIELPWSIYRGDPNWVPPLKSDVRKAFDRSKHPFFQHSEAQPYLAFRGERPVGRICAIRNRNHEAFHEEPVGFFGWFESIDDASVSTAMLDRVAEWLRERGLETMRGPTSFSTNDTAGFLVEGEEGPPALMMAYNPPYYPALLEGYGFEKAKDLFAYLMEKGGAPNRLPRVEELATRRYGVRLRHLRMSDFEAELQSVRDIYNAAWEKNWGFVPMTDAEFDFLADELKPIVDPTLAQFAENKDGETIGFILGVPDFNRVLMHLNGRLFPFGIFKALWHRRNLKFMRVIILGVREEYRGKGIDALLYMGFIRDATAAGFCWAEQSWILEDNVKMNAILERLGGRMYRRYRLYDFAL